MEINIWKNDWGLPSVDVDCLEVLAYAAFAGAPLKRIKSNNPYHSPNGQLPFLKAENGEVVSSVHAIINFLRKQSFNSEYSLSRKQCSEVSAFVELVREKLHPALQYLWWVDTKNYIEFIRPFYARAIPIPFSMYYPGQFESRAKNLMDAIYGEELDDKTVETAVYKSAEECLNLLSTRLGERDFFYGSAPCYLDAVVFAHLAPLLKTPLPSAGLQNHLKASPNLTKFVARILNRYFQTDLTEYEESKKKESETSSSKADESFPNQRTHVIASVLTGLAAMGAYSVYSGILQFSSGSSDDEYDEEEEDEYE